MPLRWTSIHDLRNSDAGAETAGNVVITEASPSQAPPPAPPDAFDTVVGQAADLLEAQWPRSSSAAGGGVAGRIQLIKRSKEALPAHFAVLSAADAAAAAAAGVPPSAPADGRVVGHCMLRQACEVADGRSAILLSVVVDPSCRRQGIGRFIVAQAEEEARRRGFAFLYLSTPDQQRFYERCGFSVTEKISTVGTASNLLDQVTGNPRFSLDFLRARATFGRRFTAATSH